jgi:endo-beta-N-acetylglucosaminidase D
MRNRKQAPSLTKPKGILNLKLYVSWSTMSIKEDSEQGQEEMPRVTELRQNQPSIILWSDLLRCKTSKFGTKATNNQTVLPSLLQKRNSIKRIQETTLKNLSTLNSEEAKCNKIKNNGFEKNSFRHWQENLTNLFRFFSLSSLSLYFHSNFFWWKEIVRPIAKAFNLI